MDQTWHPEHFVCAQCGKPFGESGYHEKDGKPFCRDDYYGLFAPKCSGCDRAIMDNYISALNGHWHPECFVCMVRCVVFLVVHNFICLSGYLISVFFVHKSSGQ